MVLIQAFGDEHYFGFVETILDEEKWYSVRYEDNDVEDLDEDEMDKIAVTFEEGEIALISPLDEENTKTRLVDRLTKGTADIVNYDKRFKNLNYDSLARYIEKRKAQELGAQEQDAEPEKHESEAWSPAWELGNVVCKVRGSCGLEQH